MILVLGASGYIGKSLCKELLLQGEAFRGIVRQLDTTDDKKGSQNLLQLGDFNKITDWGPLLNGIDHIIHCASPAYFLQHEINFDDFLSTSLEGICRLTEQAALFGVKKLVYISSIKVNGQKTIGSQNKFASVDVEKPRDPYAILKLKWRAYGHT